jgi:hypothetical protein
MGPLLTPIWRPEFPFPNVTRVSSFSFPAITFTIVEDSIRTLRNFSFITVNSDAASFGMHRLVQLAMQKWLEAHGQLEKWKLSSIRSLAREFLPEEFEDWTKCQLLFPHTKLALFEQLDTEDSRALLLHKAATYDWRKGDLNEAEDMQLKR